MHAPTAYFSLFTLACLSVLAFFTAPTIACQCEGRFGIKGEICDMDYIILASINAKEYSIKERIYRYKLNILKNFKPSDKASEILIRNELQSSNVDPTCVVHLKPRTYYIIFGKGKFLSMCDKKLVSAELSTFDHIGVNYYTDLCK